MTSIIYCKWAFFISITSPIHISNLSCEVNLFLSHHLASIKQTVIITTKWQNNFAHGKESTKLQPKRPKDIINNFSTIHLIFLISESAATKWKEWLRSGPGCIKPSQDKRVLNFCSGTINYCLEIIVTSSLNLKMFFANPNQVMSQAMGQLRVAQGLSFKDKQIVQRHWYVNEYLFLHKWDSFSQERFSTRLKWEF